AAGTTQPVVLQLDNVTVPAGQLLQVFAVGAVPDDGGQNPFQVITNAVALPTAAAPTTTPPTTMPMAPPAPAVPTSPQVTG
ncbi:MAG TPA: hypothetical protein VIJ47_00585, partial [Acidimicrobiales bacterium]